MVVKDTFAQLIYRLTKRQHKRLKKLSAKNLSLCVAEGAFLSSVHLNRYSA